MPSDEELLDVLKGILEPEGALRDIVIQPASLDQCERCIRWVRYSYRTSYSEDGQELEWKGSYAEAVAACEAHSTLLQANVEGALYNCHCFSSEYLEFDVDPREFTDEVRRQGLLDFMRGLALQADQDVALHFEPWSAVRASLVYSSTKRNFKMTS